MKKTAFWVRAAGFALASVLAVVGCKGVYDLIRGASVQFLSLEVDGGGTASTTELRLTFDRNINGLSAADITLDDTDGTGIQVAGALAWRGNGVYALPVSGISKNGTVTAKVAKEGYAFDTAERRASVRYVKQEAVKVQFLSLETDGEDTTAALTLTFSKTVEGLSAADIALADPEGTGVYLADSAGALETAVSGVYALPVSGIIKSGSVGVSVEKAGYTFAPNTLTAQVRYPEPERPIIAARFWHLEADGKSEAENSVGTAALALWFDRDIAGLSAADITLTDTGGTSILKGALTAPGEGGEASYLPGVYSLAVGGITRNGAVTVRVARAGYTFAPDAQTVQVYRPSAETKLLSLEADGGEWQETAALTLTFSQAVKGLSAADITVTDAGGNVVRTGEPAVLSADRYGATAYTLPVSGISRNGAVTVRVAKAGHTFAPDTQTAQAYGPPPVKTAFTGVEERNSFDGPTSKLALHFDGDIAGLSVADITLTDKGGTGIQKGAVVALGKGTYYLILNGVVSKHGDVTVSVQKAGYAFTPDTRTVRVYGPPIPVSYAALTADGSGAPGSSALTTAVTLTFDKAVEGLTADDITLDKGDTDFMKWGTLASNGAAYTLSVAGLVRGGTLKVSAGKRGYAFSPQVREVRAYRRPIEEKFVSLEVNGSQGEPTTALKLRFTGVIEGLSAADITVIDPQGTGLQLGEPSAPSVGDGLFATYTLLPKRLEKDGFISLKVAKGGYALEPDLQTAWISGVKLLTVEADGGYWVRGGGGANETLSPSTDWHATQWIRLVFSKNVDLTADDITLSGYDGVQKGALSQGLVLNETMTERVYWLAVSNIRWDGKVLVTVSKPGLALAPNSCWVQLYSGD